MSGELPPLLREPGEPRAPRDPADARVPFGLRVAAAWSWRLLLVAGLLSVVLYVLLTLRLVVLALVAALFVAALLRPAVVRLRGVGLGDRISGAVVFIAALVVLAAAISFVSYQVTTGLPDLTNSVTAGWNKIHHWLATGPLKLDDAQLRKLGTQARNSVQGHQSSIAAGALQGATSFAEIVTGAILALVISIILVVDGDQIARWLFTLLPESARPRARGAASRAWETLSGYVRGTVSIAFIDALTIAGGAAIIGVPLAVPIGLVTFLGAFIPIIGATVAGAIAVLVALVSKGLIAAIVMLAIVLAVNQIEAHLLQPFLLGRAVRVHPLGIILSVTVGGILAGIGGTIVAVPLVAVVKSVIIYFAGQRHQTPGQVAAAAIEPGRDADDPPPPPAGGEDTGGPGPD